LALHLILTGVYIIALKTYFKQIDKILGLFWRITKDEVGKIYHELCSKKTNAPLYEENHLGPKKKILIFTLLTFVSVCLVAPLQIIEFEMNKESHFNTMITAASLNKVMGSSGSVNFT